MLRVFQLGKNVTKLWVGKTLTIWMYHHEPVGFYDHRGGTEGWLEDSIPTRLGGPLLSRMDFDDQLEAAIKDAKLR